MRLWMPIKHYPLKCNTQARDKNILVFQVCILAREGNALQATALSTRKPQGYTNTPSIGALFPFTLPLFASFYLITKYCHTSWQIPEVLLWNRQELTSFETTGAQPTCAVSSFPLMPLPWRPRDKITRSAETTHETSVSRHPWDNARFPNSTFFFFW